MHNTVVRAIPLVNGKWPYSAPWDSETPKRIELKFGTIDCVRHATPHAKLGWRRIKGVGWGQGWKCNLACFFIFFSFSRASPEYPHTTWLFALCTRKRVLVVVRFLAYHFVPRVNCPPYIGPKPLFRSISSLSKWGTFLHIFFATDKAIITKTWPEYQATEILHKFLNLGHERGVAYVKWPTFKFRDCLHISGTAEARNFKFGMQLDHKEQ